MSVGDYFDDLETQPAEQRVAGLFARLPAFIAIAKAAAPGWGNRLSGIVPEDIASPEALASLPVLRKSDLIALQKEAPPFGGFATDRPVARVMVSPGPIFEPQADEPDPFHMARALHAAGFRRGDLMHNTFAYHLTPAGFMLDEGARKLGCAVIPAGVGNTEQQAEAIIRLRPAGYTGTPDYLKTLLDKVEELGGGPASFAKALVSGGALFPAMRQDYASRGVKVLQCYATADLGNIAYESSPDSGLILNEGLIVEIVRPGTGEPLPQGEAGEVVVTNFNETYPLIRFATGDLSAVLPGQSPCGRTNTRIKGWMGRADQSAKIKGLFVHPAQVSQIMQRHPELGRLRLVITRAAEQDVLTLKAEHAAQDDGLRARIAETLTAVTRLRGEVELVPPATLPNDGKLISDERDSVGS